jgi:hypothetical protein
MTVLPLRTALAASALRRASKARGTAKSTPRPTETTVSHTCSTVLSTISSRKFVQ